VTLLEQSLFAIAIIAAVYAVILWRRGRTHAARRALQRALIVMAGSAILGVVLGMYLHGRTP